jgi:hypothetical protein
MKKLLEYKGPPQLKQLALNMALTRLKKIYKETATSVVLSRCTSELNVILEKFEAVMKADYEWIVSL